MSGRCAKPHRPPASLRWCALPSPCCAVQTLQAEMARLKRSEVRGAPCRTPPCALAARTPHPAARPSLSTGHCACPLCLGAFAAAPCSARRLYPSSLSPASASPSIRLRAYMHRRTRACFRHSGLAVRAAAASPMHACGKPTKRGKNCAGNPPTNQPTKTPTNQRTNLDNQPFFEHRSCRPA